MMTEKELIKLGFKKQDIPNQTAYCIEDYCLKLDATGWTPYTSAFGTPGAFFTAIDTIEDLKKYYKDYADIILPD